MNGASADGRGEGEGTEGHICEIGGANSGWSLYIKESRLI